MKCLMKPSRHAVMLFAISALIVVLYGAVCLRAQQAVEKMTPVELSLNNSRLSSPKSGVYAVAKPNFVFEIHDASTNKLRHSLRGVCPWMDTAETRRKIQQLETAGTRNEEYFRLKGVTSQPTFLAFSGDGSRIVSSGCENNLYVWSVYGGNLLKTLTGPADYPEFAAFTPNNATLAAGDKLDNVFVWDINTGKQLYALVNISAKPPVHKYPPDDIGPIVDDEAPRVTLGALECRSLPSSDKKALMAKTWIARSFFRS